MRPPLVYHPAYSAPLPSSHRFPMAKFQLLTEHLSRLDLLRPEQVHQPLPVPRRWLELVHGRAYHQAFARGELTVAEERRIGLPATTPLVRRSWLAVGGTVLTARLALQHGLACHLAGGTHHAFPDYSLLSICTSNADRTNWMKACPFTNFESRSTFLHRMLASFNSIAVTFSVNAATNASNVRTSKSSAD